MKTYGIVVSKFNEMLTAEMLKLCLKGFKEQGIDPKILKVPGANEIPIAAQELVIKQNVDAIVALGVVIKGETDHYDLICRMCGDGIREVSLKNHVPIIFEVLMTDTYQKAEKRLEKAYHAAYLATEMAELIV